jgi:hypothetical protein
VFWGSYRDEGLVGRGFCDGRHLLEQMIGAAGEVLNQVQDDGDFRDGDIWLSPDVVA